MIALRINLPIGKDMSEIEAAINTVASDLPEEVTKALEKYNVNIHIVENCPEEQPMLGCYYGPGIKRSQFFHPLAFHMITLYENPIREYAKVMNQSVEEVVERVFLHEVGHFLGKGHAELKQLGV